MTQEMYNEMKESHTLHIIRYYGRMIPVMARNNRHARELVSAMHPAYRVMTKKNDRGMVIKTWKEDCSPW